MILSQPLMTIKGALAVLAVLAAVGWLVARHRAADRSLPPRSDRRLRVGLNTEKDPTPTV